MKPNTYCQLLIHIVFATKYRECLLSKTQQKETWRYIAGTINCHKHKSLIVNGISDHVHILFGLNPVMSISDLVRDIKRSSAIFINNKNWFHNRFQWQSGYGAFSYSMAQLKNVYSYIENQEEHHKKKIFKEEYKQILHDFDIKFNTQYLFSDPI